ncbi:MAG: LuxR C-terminal-related transcriptional regulator [Parahaliea sp.]
MDVLFVSPDGQLRARWRQAFADARAVPQVTEALALMDGRPRILWLDISGQDRVGILARLCEAVEGGVRVITMSTRPDEGEAYEMLSHGAVGYCHAEAAPEQLREIALVVEHGGLWMPPELVRRLMGLSLRVLPPASPVRPGLDNLTSRELMVAQQVARGASNQEIARALFISERTVKSHLSSIFEKLKVRDRVQLALVMNNIPTLAAVN